MMVDEKTFETCHQYQEKRKLANLMPVEKQVERCLTQLVVLAVVTATPWRKVLKRSASNTVNSTN